MAKILNGISCLGEMALEWEWILWLVVIVCFGLSFVGLVVPVIPSTPLVLIGFLVYQLFIGDVFLGWVFWGTMVLLTIISFIVDYLASGWLVKRAGGSKEAIWAAVLGAVAGPFILGPLGLFIGPFLAVVAVELIRKKNLQQAFQVGLASLIGFLFGGLFRGVLHIVMIVWFLFIVF